MRFRYFTITLAVTLGLLFTAAREPAAQSQQQDGLRVSVAGEVSSPGVYVVAKKGGLKLRRIVLIAGGITSAAAAKNTIIYRLDPGAEKRRAIKVDLEAILKGTAEDVDIAAEDVIHVPKNDDKK